MNEQITLYSIPNSERTDLIKRRWENALQRWSNRMMQEGSHSYGKCGYGVMCDWCEDNSFGRPCVRAINAMCREKHMLIDYTNTNFEKLWKGEVNADTQY